MNNILHQVLSLFSSNNIESVSENYFEVKTEVVCDNGKVPTAADFEAVISHLNSRDGLHISILRDYGSEHQTISNFYYENNGEFLTFLDDVTSAIQENDFKIIITIEKKNINQQISIYYLNDFVKYMKSLSLNGALSIFDKLFNNLERIIFEVQYDSFQELSTNTISIIPKNGEAKKYIIDNRTERLDKTKNICHCSIISKYKLLPDDFYPQTMSGNLNLDSLFKKLTLIYSAMFLFDVFEVNKDKIQYTLSGYKNIYQNIDISNIDNQSYELFFKIYSWVYEGGNIVDKIGLARNILSLNLEKENLLLSSTTFEAIKSGYKIYQKENIKQYIEIRNKISEQLIELQNKADKILENFISDFKKSLFAVVSFFATVIVIRVVSKGDFIGGFTIEVTLLSIGFLLISLFIMFFARWEINKQIENYEKLYQQLKERYEDLLDKSDINRILNNDKNFNSNMEFIKQKRHIYTILWVLSLITLLIILLILYFINHPCVIVNGFSIII